VACMIHDDARHDHDDVACTIHDDARHDQRTKGTIWSVKIRMNMKMMSLVIS